MEKNNVFVNELRQQSIANITKEAAYALKIHNRMEKGENLTKCKQKIMR